MSPKPESAKDLFAPQTKEYAGLIRAYEAAVRERRRAGLRSRALTSMKSYTYDELCRQGRFYDLDPSCDPGGDAEWHWVDFAGITIFTEWEQLAMANELRMPQRVRRYRWRESSLKRIAEELWPTGKAE